MYLSYILSLTKIQLNEKFRTLSARADPLGTLVDKKCLQELRQLMVDDLATGQAAFGSVC